jgi:hypothetical protein
MPTGQVQKGGVQIENARIDGLKREKEENPTT